MLGPENLRRLGQYRGTAEADEKVCGAAEGRIGGDTRPGVRAAAFQSEDQLARRDRLALPPVRRRQHLPDDGDACLDGLFRAAPVLDDEITGVRALRQAVIAGNGADGVGFASKAHDQEAGNVGVAGIAGDHPLQMGIGDAAEIVGEGDDAVHIREFGEGVAQHRVGPKRIGDAAADGGRAIDGGQDQQIVAGAGAAVIAAITLECRGGAGRRLDGGEGSAGGVALEVADLDIVGVDVGAFGNAGRGKADGPDCIS